MKKFLSLLLVLVMLASMFSVVNAEEDVLLMRVVYRYTQKEISESLRVSQSKISRILKNIVEKIV